MIHHKKICRICQTPQYIKGQGLCKFCYPKHREKRVPLNLKDPVKKEKEPSMLEFFHEIWNERLPGNQIPRLPKEIDQMTTEEYFKFVGDYRICAVTLEPLPHFMIGIFSHVLTRNFTKYKFEKRNLVMLQPFIHQLDEFEAGAKLLKYYGGAKLHEYKELLKEEYYRLK